MEVTSNKAVTSAANHQDESLVSEAATTLAHLASSVGSGMSPSTRRACAKTNNTSTEREQNSSPAGEALRIPSLSTTARSNSISSHHSSDPFPAVTSANHAASSSVAGPAASDDEGRGLSVPELIKQAVLRRLNRPEDIVKRNMFAVEGKSIKFPVKLMYLLDECREFQTIISWAEDGHSFIIHDPNAFEDKVLPKIFKEARFSSFLRKLTRWGFMKKSTPFGIKFFQRKFQKGNYSLCIDITCCNKGSTIVRGANRNFEATIEEHRRLSTSNSASGSALSRPTLHEERSSAGVHAARETGHNTNNPEEESFRGGGAAQSNLQAVSSASTLLNTTASFARRGEDFDAAEQQNGASHHDLNETRIDNPHPSVATQQDSSSNAMISEQNLRILSEIARSNNDQTLAEMQSNLQDILHHSSSRSLSLPNERVLRDQQETELMMELLRNRRNLNTRADRTVIPPSPLLQERLLHFMLEQEGNLRGVNLQEQQNYVEMLNLISGNHHFNHESNILGNNNYMNSFLPHQLSNHGRIHSQIMSTALEGLISSQGNNADVGNNGRHSLPGRSGQSSEDALRERLIEENALAAAARSQQNQIGAGLGDDELLLREQLLRRLSRSLPSQGGDQHVAEHLLQMQQYQQEYPLSSCGVARSRFQQVDRPLGQNTASQGAGAAGDVPNENDNINLIAEMIRRRSHI